MPDSSIYVRAQSQLCFLASLDTISIIQKSVMLPGIPGHHLYYPKVSRASWYPWTTTSIIQKSVVFPGIPGPPPLLSKGLSKGVVWWVQEKGGGWLFMLGGFLFRVTFACEPPTEMEVWCTFQHLCLT